MCSQNRQIKFLSKLNMLVYCACLLGVFPWKAIQEKRTDKPRWTLLDRFALLEIYFRHIKFFLLFITSDFSARFNKVFSAPHTRRQERFMARVLTHSLTIACRTGERNHWSKNNTFSMLTSHNIHETLFFISTESISTESSCFMSNEKSKTFCAFLLPCRWQWDGKSIHFTNNILLFWINFAFSPKSFVYRDHDKLCVYVQLWMPN